MNTDGRVTEAFEALIRVNYWKLDAAQWLNQYQAAIREAEESEDPAHLIEVNRGAERYAELIISTVDALFNHYQSN